MAPAHAATKIAVMQTFLIFGGIFSVCMMLKAFGYPDPTIPWNPWAVAVREWGVLLLLIPGIWAGLAIYWENRSGLWTTRDTVVSGVAVLGALFVFFFVTAARARYWGMIQATPAEVSRSVD